MPWYAAARGERRHAVCVPSGTWYHARHSEPPTPWTIQPQSPPAPTGPSSPRIPNTAYVALAIGAVGVVYGDIGTSPLYAIKESFGGTHSLPVIHDNVVGVLSLMSWALFVIVTLKYVMLIMRADNRGEGGIMALIALVRRSFDGDPRLRWLLLTLGMFGAALFYGDGMITPAISVLSAVEGLEVVTPVLKPYVIPITLLVITALFLVQQTGTGRVGAFFGPIMVRVVRGPGACWAWSASCSIPACWRRSTRYWGVKFFVTNGRLGFLVLGAVVLAVTGAEALYADMGHFGKRPIRLAWLCVRVPGAAAQLLRPGGAAAARARSGPASLLPPGARLGRCYPLVLLATARHGDRLAGGDLGRVLAHASGDPARLLSAPDDRAHLGEGDRPGLPAVDQLGALLRGRRAGAGLRLLERLWPAPTASP